MLIIPHLLERTRWRINIPNAYTSTARSFSSSAYIKSALLESFRDIRYVSISNVQLPHSIVVSMMYSLTNQSTTPVVAQVEVVERGDRT
jgi:hypothetical protein